MNVPEDLKCNEYDLIICHFNDRYENLATDHLLLFY